MPAAATSMSAPEMAAAPKRHATNSNPLPRNTVAKNRSSSSPRRSRSTPMNHRNAIPANGTRYSASRTAARRSGSVSQTSGCVRSDGTALRAIPIATIISSEKITPAMAAPRGARVWRGGFDVFDVLVTVFSSRQFGRDGIFSSFADLTLIAYALACASQSGEIATIVRPSAAHRRQRRAHPPVVRPSPHSTMTLVHETPLDAAFQERYARRVKSKSVLSLLKTPSEPEFARLRELSSN